MTASTFVNRDSSSFQIKILKEDNKKRISYHMCFMVLWVKTWVSISKVLNSAKSTKLTKKRISNQSAAEFKLNYSILAFGF